MGISEAFYIPAALALIADFHRGPTRSRAVGLHQMAIYCGVIVGGFGGYAADHPTLGWRLAFDVCGVFGILYALPLFILLRKDRRSNRIGRQPAERRRPADARCGSCSSNGSFILLVLYFTLPALAGWVVRDWMPAILKEQFGIGQGLAGVAATLYWQSRPSSARSPAAGWPIAGCGGRPRGRIFTSALGMALIVPAIFGVGYAPETGPLWVAVAFLILFGLGWGFFDCNNMPILCQIVRARAARDGLRHHELRQHQLRRLRRLGLRHAARSARARSSGSSASSPAPPCSRRCWCC